MTLNDWITKYEAKAEKFILLPGFSIYYEPSKGFFCYAIFGNVLEIDHTCTNDGKWAHDTAIHLAKENGCTMLRTQTFRDPAAYMRFTGSRINLSMSGLRPNGAMYWCFEKGVI